MGLEYPCAQITELIWNVAGSYEDKWMLLQEDLSILLQL